MRAVTIGTPLTSTVDMIVFGALTLWFAIRVTYGRDLPDTVSSLLHLAMSGAMLAMPASWGASTPVQIVVFSAGAFWYGGLALFRPAADARLGVGPLSHGTHGGGLWYHAAMMLAMVWMAVAMTPAGPGVAEGGMTMGMGAAHATGEAMTGHTTWALAVSIGLGAAFAIATLQLAVLLIREAAGDARRLVVADLTASTAMAAGMAFAFLVLTT